MDEKLFSALMAASVSALSVGLHAIRVLANRGLVPPEEVDAIAHGLSIPFDEFANDEIGQKVRAVFDASLSGAMAEVYQSAKANWKGQTGQG